MLAGRELPRRRARMEPFGLWMSGWASARPPRPAGAFMAQVPLSSSPLMIVKAAARSQWPAMLIQRRPVGRRERRPLEHHDLPISGRPRCSRLERDKRTSERGGGRSDNNDDNNNNNDDDDDSAATATAAAAATAAPPSGGGLESRPLSRTITCVHWRGLLGEPLASIRPASAARSRCLPASPTSRGCWRQERPSRRQRRRRRQNH